MENHHFSWENPLFLWVIFNSKLLQITRGYVLWSVEYAKFVEVHHRYALVDLNQIDAVPLNFWNIPQITLVWLLFSLNTSFEKDIAIKFLLHTLVFKMNISSNLLTIDFDVHALVVGRRLSVRRHRLFCLFRQFRLKRPHRTLWHQQTGYRLIFGNSSYSLIWIWFII